MKSLAPILNLMRDDALLPLARRALRWVCTFIHPLDPACLHRRLALGLAYLERPRRG